jgi:hypothetical protein
MAWGIGVAMPSGFRCGKRFRLYLNHPNVSMTFMPTAIRFASKKTPRLNRACQGCHRAS